jgi:phenylacetate-CoA ligase
MEYNSFIERRACESLSRDALTERQLQKLNTLLTAILPQNAFYQDKLASEIDLAAVPRGVPSIDSLATLAKLPFTFKEELISPHSPGNTAHLGDLFRNRTYPLERYVRYHQTSGTHGRPLAVFDTAEDWNWWLDCWQYVLDAAEIGMGDVALMAFSFGPFIGFWTAFEAALQRGCRMAPAGGMRSLSRLDLLRQSQATVIFCTPSYALHLAEVGKQNQIDVGKLQVRTLVVAGEPGGSSEAVRARLSETWQASVIDHAGATEVGAWGYGDASGRGLFVLETEFIPEFLSLETGKPATEGELSELVITSLGRFGAPLIRYRTGDLVRPSWRGVGENRFVLLEGGVLGRADEMLHVRGVNLFPAALDNILRGFPEIVEYQAAVQRDQEMDQLTIQIEDHLDDPQRVAQELQIRLGLRAEVTCVPLGSLPRFEGKGKRLVDLR